MRHNSSIVLGSFLALGLALAGCAETSTAGESEAAETVFPEPDKPVRMIVPYGVGGGTDIGARLLAEDLNDILDINIQVENMEGASGQVGLTELVGSEPDGYTIGWANTPITQPIYLDESRNAGFTGDDLVPIANYVFDPAMFVVKKDAPYESLADLVEAARRNPGRITVSASAVLSPGDMVIRAVEQAANVDFNTVYFSTAGEQRSALLGGQVDVESGSVSEAAGALQSGQVRGITVFDENESAFAPGVTTATSAGYDVSWGSSRILVVPKGTPQEVIDTWGSAVKEAIDRETERGDFEKFFLSPRYMDSSDTAAFIKTVEEQVQEFMDQVATE